MSRAARRRGALQEMERRYPIPAGEVEPSVFVRATDNRWEMSARFVVPVRTSRSVKSELTKRVRDRFEQASEQFVRFPAVSAPEQG